MGIERYFDEFDRKICADYIERSTVTTVLKDVERHLGAELEVIDTFITGSFTSRTAVYGFSDVDVFIQVPERRLPVPTPYHELRT